MGEEVHKRQRLVNSAVELFHQQGIKATSLQHIADSADVPIGNVYYYFKTKEQIGIAAAEQRMQDLKLMTDEWSKQSNSPLSAILLSFEFFLEVKEAFAKYGCPAAAVCQERLASDCNIGKEFAKLFDKKISWYEDQFKKEKFSTADSKNYAMQILIRIQGAGLMAKAMNNADIISNEIENLKSWIYSLAKSS